MIPISRAETMLFAAKVVRAIAREQTPEGAKGALLSSIDSPLSSDPDVAELLAEPMALWANGVLNGVAEAMEFMSSADDGQWAKAVEKLG